MSDTDRLLALVPALMTVHNLEEYLGMERYARRRGLPVGRRQVQIALGLATLLPAVLAVVAAVSPRGSRRKKAGLILPGLMLANAASHAGQTLIFHDRSPGTITALGLYIPFGLWLAERAVDEGYLTPAGRRQVLGLGALLMAPATILVQGLGWLGERLLAGRGRGTRGEA